MQVDDSRSGNSQGFSTPVKENENEGSQVNEKNSKEIGQHPEISLAASVYESEFDSENEEKEGEESTNQELDELESIKQSAKEDSGRSCVVS